MTTSTQWQLARDAAARYEEILVPAILGPAARALVEWADIRKGEAVLDVGCGTGSATRFAAKRAGASGRVVGLDVNAGMIDVARSIAPAGAPEIEWIEHSAYELPFEDGELDVVLFAQTLQFLQDRLQALAEAHRVLAPGGRVVVSSWCEIRENPYFDALVQAVSRHIGPETAAGLEAAFSLHDAGTVRALFSEASFSDVRQTAKRLDLELPPPHDFVPWHVSATPMSTGFAEAPDPARQRVLQGVWERTREYAVQDGIRVPFRTLLVTATREA